MEAHGFLFSALTLESSPLHQWWETISPQMKALFPALKVKAPADLHVTLVYVGRWNSAYLPVFQSASIVSPQEDQKLLGHLHYFGVGNRVLGLDLRGFTDGWAQAVISAREDLERAGLRGRSPHDAVFRPHVSLVECADKRPTPEQRVELTRCHEWLALKIPGHGVPVPIPAGAAAHLLLAGVGPGYISMKEFLARP